jgi:hypothetical protein
MKSDLLCGILITTAFLTLIPVNGLVESNLSLQKALAANQENQEKQLTRNCNPSANCVNITKQSLSFPGGDNNLIDQRINQIQTCNNHLGCNNTGVQGASINASQSSITQHLTQIQNCNIDSTCNNESCDADVIGVGTENPELGCKALAIGKLAGNDIQILRETTQVQNCSDNSTCQTVAEHLGANSDSHNSANGKIEQIQNCNGNTSCSDNGVNIASIGIDGSNNNQLVQNMNQKEQCSIDSNCQNGGDNTGVVADTSTNTNLRQSVSQGNDCLGNSTCGNFGGTNTRTVRTDRLTINQEVNQGNNCLVNSECTNENIVDLLVRDRQAENIDVSINQNNKCYRDSTCKNDFSKPAPIDNSISTDQSNLCANGSSCQNTGTDNDTTCAHNSVCNNSGTNTRVIGQSANCNNIGNDTTTICQPGRTVSIPNN